MQNARFQPVCNVRKTNLETQKSCRKQNAVYIERTLNTVYETVAHFLICLYYWAKGDHPKEWLFVLND